MRLQSSGHQLFHGSDDDDAEEEDGSRFDIKPQFEGRAGKKVRKGVYLLPLFLLGS